MALTPTISWNEVTTNADGTPITDLAGYRIYYATTPTFEDTLGYFEVLVPCRLSLKLTSGLTKYVNNYFLMVAFDTSNNESAFSAVTSTLVSGGLIMK